MILQSTEPFFSNDWEGLAKVIGFLVALTLGAWKMLNSALVRRVEKLEEEQEKTIERRIVVDKAIGEMKLMQNDIQGLQDSFDSFCKKQERFFERLDEKDDKVTGKLEKLTDRVASLEGTVRTSATFGGDLVNAIKEVIRESK